MNDSLIIDGEVYISSRRASEISGYARDHIGYLARRADLVGRLIGGHWYVSERSLQEYRKKIDEYVPQAPNAASRTPDPESVISFDGKEYVSVGKGAELTGYNQDYVGQLCRQGKILSRHLGKRWYIERNALLDHKMQKDSLLAAVQVKSVGLHRPNKAAIVDVHYDDGGPYMTYTNDDGYLLPALPEKTNDGGVSRRTEMPISSHISYIRRQAEYVPSSRGAGSTNLLRSRKWHLFRNFTTAIATIVIVIAVGYVSVQSRAIYTNVETRDAAFAIAARSATGLTWILELVEKLVTRELHYLREF